MINELVTSIKDHWLNNKSNFVSDLQFRGSKIKIIFDRFQSGPDLIHVITMELFREDQSSARQEIVMGDESKLKQLLETSEFTNITQARLETLHTAIEEIYDDQN